MAFLWLLPQIARTAAGLEDVDILRRIDPVDEWASPLRRHAQLTVRAIVLETKGGHEAAATLTAVREIFARLGAKLALAETDELMKQVAFA